MMGPLHIEMAFVKAVGKLRSTFFSIKRFFLCFDIRHDYESDTNNFDSTTNMLQALFGQ